MQAPHEVCTDYARTLIRIKARQLRRRPSFQDTEQADVEQDLTLYLLSQAEHFDPARGSLNTFIARVVDSAVAMMVRERKREKRVPAEGIDVESLADIVEQPDGPPAPLAALVSGADLQRRVGTVPLTDAELYELIEGVGCANWEDFLAACKLVAQGDHQFKTIVIDTIDNAFKFCSDLPWRCSQPPRLLPTSLASFIQ